MSDMTGEYTAREGYYSEYTDGYGNINRNNYRSASEEEHIDRREYRSVDNDRYNNTDDTGYGNTNGYEYRYNSNYDNTYNTGCTCRESAGYNSVNSSNHDNTYNTGCTCRESTGYNSINSSNYKRAGNSGSINRKKSGSSTAGIIGNILLSVAFAGMCLMFVLWIFGIEPRIVASGSMEPEIRVGSLCFINTRADYDKLEVGDVIAYYALDGSQVTHRIVEFTDEGIITQGDANRIPDGIPVTDETYIGKTETSIPYVGYAFAFMQTTTGKIIVISLVIVMLLIQVIQTRSEIMFRRKRIMQKMLSMK